MHLCHLYSKLSIAASILAPLLGGLTFSIVLYLVIRSSSETFLDSVDMYTCQRIASMFQLSLLGSLTLMDGLRCGCGFTRLLSAQCVEAYLPGVL